MHYLLLAMLIFISTAYAQSSSETARNYLYAAEIAYEGKDYNGALSALNKVEKMMGRSGARLAALRVKIYADQAKWFKAKKALKQFYSFSPKEAYARKISPYAIKVDDALEREQKRLDKIQRSNEQAELKLQQLAEATRQKRLKEIDVAKQAWFQLVENGKGNVSEKNIRNYIARYKSSSSYLDEAEALLIPFVEAKKAKAKALQLKKDKVNKQLLSIGIGRTTTVAGGKYIMGADLGFFDYAFEKPAHEINITTGLEVGIYEVTFAQWDTCVSDGGCGRRYGPDNGWGRGDTRPMIGVNLSDARSFAKWLNKKSKQLGIKGGWRLPSEAEWEYLARAGTTTKYSWGKKKGKGKATCKKCGSKWDNKMPAPVGSFKPNNFGLYDMHGNLLELVEDCWNKRHRGTTGKAIKSGKCHTQIARGGSYRRPADEMASYHRIDYEHERVAEIGFRIVRSIQ